MCHYFIAVFSFSSFCQILQFQLEICQYGVEMGRMSDYDIRPKPKVWAGSPNECWTFGRMMCARMKQQLLLGSA